MPLRPPVATAGAFVALGLATAGVLLGERVPADHWQAVGLSDPRLDGIAGTALAVAGAVVLRRRAHPLGWLLVAGGVWWALDAASGAWMTYATLSDPALPGAAVAFWIYMRLGAGLLLILPVVLLLYPDGRLPRGRWGIASRIGLAATALLPVLLLAVPSSIAELESGDAPLPPAVLALDVDVFSLPLPDTFWQGALRVAYLLVPVSLVVPFLVVVGRHRRATGRRRLQLRWLLWAALVDVLIMLAFAVLPDGAGSYGLTAAVSVTSTAVAIGLLRPDLVDVDRLLDSTLVYGALVVLSYLLDLALLAGAGRVLGARLTDTESLVLAVFVVSALYAPLRHRLWRLVRRTARGERDDPYRVMSRLAARLESSDNPDDQLMEVARAVSRAFRTSYAAVEVLQADGARTQVEHGRTPGATEAMAIAYRGEPVGWLHLPAGPRQRLRPGDEALLADMVRQAAAAARAAQLADQLQASRERLVSAVEDERRRLRNELHDGLGPTLAAVASRIDTARITARRSPEQSDEVLALARTEITEVIGELRRLVHGLRPPALDDVGLAGAVRQQVDRLRSPGLDVTMEVHGDLAGLPAATEVAAYRIVSEALTNVVRHAAATRAAVEVRTTSGELVVAVTDDGRGIASDAAAGVGLVSMRERARELGGTCEVLAHPAGGTRVAARLPAAAPGGSR